nr:hypothetical protein [Cedecea lapagei]
MDQKTQSAGCLTGRGLITEVYLNQFSRMLTKLAVETALNAELTGHLGMREIPQKQARIPAMATHQKRCFSMTVKLS